MYRHKLYLGLHNKTGEIINVDIARKWLFNQLKIRGLDATVTNGTGIFKGETEPCIIVEIYHGKLSNSPRILGQLYVHEFNQESVLYIIEKVISEFIN